MTRLLELVLSKLACTVSIRPLGMLSRCRASTLPPPWRSLLLVAECGLDLLPAVSQVLDAVDVGDVLGGMGIQEVAQVGAVVCGRGGHTVKAR